MAAGNTTLAFADLNFDCLRLLFKYLSIRDAFNTIGVFGANVDEVAYERIWQTKHLTIEMRFPPAYPVMLFSLLGQSIESFYISVGYSLQKSEALNILRPICNAGYKRCLRKLNIKYIYFDEDYWECIAPLATQITDLDLANCQLTAEFLTRILEKFTTLSRLRIQPNPISDEMISSICPVPFQSVD